MFNIADILGRLFYIALLVLLFVLVVKAFRFYKTYDKDELHDRLKKG
ncbi:hypothetical protein ACFQ9Y_03600 [Peribacillus simplex]